MKKKISTVAALFLLVTLMTSQFTASAYSVTKIPYQHTGMLQFVDIYVLYPGTVNTGAGNTTQIRGVWLGTASGGGGIDWKFVLKDPAKGSTHTIAKNHYTYVAFVVNYKTYPGSPAITLYKNNVATSTTTIPLNEKYNSAGVRIVNTGTIYHDAYTLIIPIGYSTSNTYTLNSVYLNDAQNYSFTINWT